MKNTTVDSLVSLMDAVISSAEGSCRKDGEKVRWTRGQRCMQQAAPGVGHVIIRAQLFVRPAGHPCRSTLPPDTCRLPEAPNNLGASH